MGMAEPTIMSIDMSSPNLALHQVMAWLSPSYPIGAFSYSHGLEYVIEIGDVSTPEDLHLWLRDILQQGSGWNDAVLLSHAYHAQTIDDLQEVADLAISLCASRERHLETMSQGKAFAKITAAVWNIEIPPMPLPICLGWAAARQSIPLDTLLPLYLHSFIANLIAAGIRHIPIGQTDGQQVLSALFGPIDQISGKAQQASLAELSNICLLADLASMHHETMKTRIYRT